MNHGDILKKIRISRGFTQQQLAKGISSQAAVSRMEASGNIPIDLLLKFLDRLGVYPFEFFIPASESNRFEPKLFWDHKIDAAKCPKRIHRLIDKEMDLYKKTNFLNHKINMLGYRAIYYKFYDKLHSDSEEIASELKSYILNFNSWLIYNFTLYTNLLFLFDDYFIKTRHQTIIKFLYNLPLDSIQKHHYKMVYTNNAIFLAFERKNIGDLDFYMATYQDSIKNDSLSLNDRIYNSFYTQLHDLMRNFDIKKYKKLINYLNIFRDYKLDVGYQNVVNFINNCLSDKLSN